MAAVFSAALNRLQFPSLEPPTFQTAKHQRGVIAWQPPCNVRTDTHTVQVRMEAPVYESFTSKNSTSF
jgi:hypothetical protein